MKTNEVALRQQVEALTRERDEARSWCNSMRMVASQLLTAVGVAKDELAIQRAARDQLRESLRELPGYNVSDVDDMLLPNAVSGGSWIRRDALLALLASTEGE